MNEVFYTEPFSDLRRDQINLTTVGGSISYDLKGNPCFHFPTAEARNEYLSRKFKEKGREAK